jgi:glutathione reductase (NADPH)
MAEYDYDYFVIGAGSGGVRSARIAAGHGARVAIAEEDRVGGTCVIRGCVPKKLLVYGSHFAEDLADAKRFGWDVGTPTFHWPTLRDNVLADVDRINGAYESALANAQVETKRARATFLDPHTLQVGEERITADKILIATGAAPAMPAIRGVEHAISSNETFHLDALPERIVIAGSGYIANEFAGIFHELGVDVTLVVRGASILRGWDHSLVERLLTISTVRGIKFRFNCEIEAIERLENGRQKLRTKCGDDIETDLTMFAIGRDPNTRGLGCEAAGIGLDNKGAVMVDENCRTAAENVYAVGDVINRVQLTPVAIREGQAVADHLFADKPVALDYGCIPSAVFSAPPMAGVGMTESEARDRLGSISVFSSDFRPMKNTLTGRQDHAHFKLIVDSATDKLVGAHMIGPESAEIMQALAIAVKAGLTKAQVDQTVAIHPTMAEELVLMRH